MHLFDCNTMCAADTRYFCQPSRQFKTFPVKVWRPSEPVKEPIHSSRALKHSLLCCSFLMPSSFTTRWLNIMAVNSVLGVRHTGIGLLSFMMLRQLHHSVVNTSWIRVGLDRDTCMTGRIGQGPEKTDPWPTLNKPSFAFIYA